MVMDEGMTPSGNFSMTCGRTDAMSVDGSTVKRNWPLRLWKRRIMMAVLWMLLDRSEVADH